METVVGGGEVVGFLNNVKSLGVCHGTVKEQEVRLSMRFTNNMEQHEYSSRQVSRCPSASM